MNDKKKSFIIHKDSCEIFDDLTNEQAGILIKAIGEYQRYGVISELESGLKIVLKVFIRQFESDNEKWKKIAERNAANGSKGGRPKTQDNPENPVGYLGTQKTQTNPDEPRKAVTGTVTDTGTVTEVNTPLSPLPENLQLEKLAEGAFQIWQMLAKEQEVKFTNDEWNALKGFTITKPSLRPHQITGNIIYLNKCAQEGLDIEKAILLAAKMEPRYAQIKQPFAAKVTDAKGNPIYGQAVVERRNRIIEQEERAKE